MSEPKLPLTLRATELGPAVPPRTREVAITGMPRRIRLGAPRDAGAAALPVTAAADDVVRVEYENGLALWMRADDLLKERGERIVGRGAAGAEWIVDPSPRPGLRQRSTADRGVVGIGIKVLEIFGVDLKKKSAALLSRTFEERQLKGHAPGLYRVPFDAGGAQVALDATAPPLPADRPILLFLHGTMSSVMGSFGDLWSTTGEDGGRAALQAREALRARYGADVYAFEHRTLTESPIQNALDLVGHDSMSGGFSFSYLLGGRSSPLGQTPIPPSLILFISALGVLALAAQQRRKAAQ